MLELKLIHTGSDQMYKTGHSGSSVLHACDLFILMTDLEPVIYLAANYCERESIS